MAGSPKRSLGQVFLNSGAVVEKIVRALGPGPQDHVVEIGPGRGALTLPLSRVAGRLTLVEKDSDLVPGLRDRFGRDRDDAEVGGGTVRVVEADATQIDLLDLVAPDEPPVLVAGNLPYNAGGPILFNLLRRRDRIARLVVMLQREVVERLAAAPGTREHGAVSTLVQVRARVENLFDVGPGKFIPHPAVWSAVARLTPAPFPHPRAADVDDPRFGRLVHALHAQPRKTVANSLADGLSIGRPEAAKYLEAAGIDPGVRPSLVGPAQALDLWAVWSGTPTL